MPIGLDVLIELLEDQMFAAQIRWAEDGAPASSSRSRSTSSGSPPPPPPAAPPRGLTPPRGARGRPTVRCEI